MHVEHAALYRPLCHTQATWTHLHAGTCYRRLCRLLGHRLLVLALAVAQAEVEGAGDEEQQDHDDHGDDPHLMGGGGMWGKSSEKGACSGHPTVASWSPLHSPLPTWKPLLLPDEEELVVWREVTWG